MTPIDLVALLGPDEHDGLDASLVDLLDRALWRPDQKRKEKGDPDGGQFTQETGSQIAPADRPKESWAEYDRRVKNQPQRTEAYNPPDAEDDEDYDWQEPTASTAKAADALAKKYSTPEVPLEWSAGEKNYIYFRPKRPARRTGASARHLYRPDQERDPGGEGGGQWVYEGKGDTYATKRQDVLIHKQIKGTSTHSDPAAAAEAYRRVAEIQDKHADAWTADVASEEGTDRHYATGQKDPTGTYQVYPEGSPRRELHDAIIEKYKAGNEPLPDGEPQDIIWMGGGPAAGKSTMLNSGAIDEGDLTHRVSIDPDGVKEDLPEFWPLQDAKDPRSGGFVHEESSDIAKRLQAEVLPSGLNITIDGTGDKGLKDIEKKVGAIRAAARPGSKIRAFYATNDAELAMKLMIDRGQKTGRYVPADVLRDTHIIISRILPQVIEKDLFDELTLFDTNVKDQARPILTARRGQKPVIHDQALYEAFIAKGTAETSDERATRLARGTGARTANARAGVTHMATDGPDGPVPDVEERVSMAAEITLGMAPGRSRFAIDGRLPPAFQRCWDVYKQGIDEMKAEGQIVDLPAGAGLP